MMVAVVVATTRLLAMPGLIRLDRHCVEPWLGCWRNVLMDRWLVQLVALSLMVVVVAVVVLVVVTDETDRQAAAAAAYEG